ncbi:hypothetical protein GALL_477620 [mine drainage metagenome]|uniref:Uncharacterized protein n=1 Tax=mine drainage metagenome TaxID=410659 RepID=A0A1J5PGR5_9ZZZZ
MPGDISISFINCAGRQKCIPTTRSGLSEPVAISVIESVEVFDAKIVSSAQTASRRFSNSRFTDNSSYTASMTRSHSASAAISVL